MARRSPPLVNQKYDTGCTWRMFGIFNFCRHLNTATGNGNSRSGSDVLSTIDEKYPHIGVSSRRRRDYGCKCISVENDQVADLENEITKMIVNQRLFNKKYQGKDGPQFLDAVQILYSNKELFVKLLQDPNSLLARQIHDMKSSQVKEPYQARQKRMNRLNKSQNSNARQYAKHLKTFDKYNLSSNCEPQSSKEIVVLKPGTVNGKFFADSSFGIKPSHFPFGRIKRKLRHVMRVRRKEQKWRTSDAVPCKFPCSKNVKELEISERNSPINVHASTGKSLNSYLDLKKRDKVIIQLKDSELCMGQEASSFGESSDTNNTNNSSVNPSEQNTLNMHVEGRKGPSHMLNCGTGKYKKCTNPIERTIPLPEHGSVTERMRYHIHNNHQMVLSGAEISVRMSLGDHLHTHDDIHIPKDGGYNDSPTHNLDIDNTTRGLESFEDWHPEIQIMSFSPDIASSSPSSCQRIEDTVNMRNRVELEHPTTESVIHDKFEENHLADLIRSSFLDPMNKLTSSKDFLRKILQALCLKCDELIMKSNSLNQLMDPSNFDELKGLLTGQLSGSTVLHDCIVETYMELLYKNCGFPFPPHFSSKNPNFQACIVRKVLVKEITELVELHFPPCPSPITLQQLVEKDLARRGSWLNVQVDAEDIAIEVEKDVLDKLLLEIASEMDIRDMMHCNEHMAT